MMAKQMVKSQQVSPAVDVYEELKAKASQLVSCSNIEELQVKVDAGAKELQHLEEVCERLSGVMGKVKAAESGLKEDSEALKEELQRLEKEVDEARKDVQKYEDCTALLKEGTGKIETTWKDVNEKATAHFTSLVARSKERLFMANPSLPPDHPINTDTLLHRKALLQAVLSGSDTAAPHTTYPEVTALQEKTAKLRLTLDTLTQIDANDKALPNDNAHTYADRYSRLTKQHIVIDELCRDIDIQSRFGDALLAAGEKCREALKDARVKATNVSEVVAVTHDLQRQSEECTSKVTAHKQAVEALQKEVDEGRASVATLQREVSGGIGRLEAVQRSINEVSDMHNETLQAVASRTEALAKLNALHVAEAKEAAEQAAHSQRTLSDMETKKEALKQDVLKKASLGLGSVVKAKEAEVVKAKATTEYFTKQQGSLEFGDRHLDALYTQVVLTDEQLAQVDSIVQRYTKILQCENNDKEQHLRVQMTKITKSIETSFENSDEYAEALKAMQQEIAALAM